MKHPYIFRQLFDEKTWTYSYIVADPTSKEACIIDPVRDHTERDLTLLSELGLTLKYILDTHIHADHITGSGALRARTQAQIAMGSAAAIAHPDILFENKAHLRLGTLEIEALSTPGHTDACMSYRIEDMVFTGDALLIRKTGRTDFQQGSPTKLFNSIKEQLYTLPDDTKVYPGHDYEGFTMSTIAEEKQFNTRITESTTHEAFVATLSALKLDYPKYIDVALPANMRLGGE